ncbi:ABC transporter substrate-binding protein [Carnobacterium sp.]|uniref:ABC transporter substrate-binding protein n=1 Tax=Carnobacterium sp. TaxID=48221 RepID=UPI003C7752C6
MNMWKKMALSGVSMILAGTLAACGSTDSKAEGNDKDEVTLQMYQIGDKPENYDTLMGKANEIIKEETGVTANINYIGWGDYSQKMSVMISSGETYDIAFADNYVANAQKGAFADLTELMPEYAEETYNQLDEAYIKGNLVDGKLYAFPVNANVFAQQVLTFNKAYLDKHDLSIDDVKSYKDAEEVLKAFHEKEPTVAAFAIGQGFKAQGNYDYPLGNGMPFAINLDGDKEKIVNQYNDKDYVETLKTMHNWYKAGLIPADAATSNTGFPLEGNTWFMRGETQGPFDYGDTLLTNAAGQELVSKAITTPLKSTSQAQMANFVVGNSSKNKEKAVEVLGLINSNPELLNGLIYGIEGEAWEKVEGSEDKIKLLDGYKPNQHMSAWNTGNNAILYTQDTITDEMIAERDKSIEESIASPILGFNFNTKNVKTEITNISNVMNQYLDSLNTGTVNPDEVLPKLIEGLESAGYEKVLDEMQGQYDEFLKEAK